MPGAQPALLWLKGPSGWVPALADAAGHFQVDVLSCANPGNLDKALSTWLPLGKGRVNNTALPAANTNLLGTSVSPTVSPSLLLVYVCISVAGIFYVTRTVGGATWAEYLNSKIPLVAEAAYMFTVSYSASDIINFRYTVTTGTTLCLDVLEVVQ